MISLVLTLIVVSFRYACPAYNQYKSHDYTYSNKDVENGPSAWGPVCLAGSQQSPIDVRYRDHGVNWGYTKMYFNLHFQSNQRGFYYTNNGHTFKIQLTGNRQAPNSQLSTSGAGFKHRYTFAQMHFHWGDRDEVGSEHTLQGKRYSMEIHMVMYKSKYENISYALESKDHDAINVLAILCEVGKENPHLRPVVEEISNSISDPDPGTLKHSTKDLNLFKILPQQLDFVRYKGSLTSPPCNEAVAWTIFLCPIQISTRQLETFRRLRGSEYYNYRSIQKLNGRKLTYYKVPDQTQSRRFSSSSNGGGWGGAVLAQTLTSTLKEVNSLFYNVINAIKETPFCDETEAEEHKDEDVENFIEVEGFNSHKGTPVRDTNPIKRSPNVSSAQRSLTLSQSYPKLKTTLPSQNSSFSNVSVQKKLSKVTVTTSRRQAVSVSHNSSGRRTQQS